MNAKELGVIDDFLILSELLDDDIDLICDFIRDKIPKSMKRYKRSRVKMFIENADYGKIDNEINYLLDISIVEYKTYMIFYKIKKKIEQGKLNCMQTTIFDYMWTR